MGVASVARRMTEMHWLSAKQYSLKGAAEELKQELEKFTGIRMLVGVQRDDSAIGISVVDDHCPFAIMVDFYSSIPDKAVLISAGTSGAGHDLKELNRFCQEKYHSTFRVFCTRLGVFITKALKEHIHSSLIKPDVTIDPASGCLTGRWAVHLIHNTDDLGPDGAGNPVLSRLTRNSFREYDVDVFSPSQARHVAIAKVLRTKHYSSLSVVPRSGSDVPASECRFIISFIYANAEARWAKKTLEFEYEDAQGKPQPVKVPVRTIWFDGYPILGEFRSDGAPYEIHVRTSDLEDFIKAVNEKLWEVHGDNLWGKRT